MLIASENNDSYQCLFVDTPFSEINNATSRNFSPQESGDFAAIISKYGCSDTTRKVSYEYTCENSYSYISIDTLDYYTWDLNNTTYTESGNYIDTLPNYLNCDSIL